MSTRLTTLTFYSNESEILYEQQHDFGQGRGSENEVMVKINAPKVHSYQPLIEAGNSNASMHVLLDLRTILNRYTIFCVRFFHQMCDKIPHLNIV